MSEPRTPSAPLERGTIVRYHPIIGDPRYVRARVVSAPYEVGSGDTLVKLHELGTNRPIYAYVGAVESDHG